MIDKFGDVNFFFDMKSDAQAPIRNVIFFVAAAREPAHSASPRKALPKGRSCDEGRVTNRRCCCDLGDPAFLNRVKAAIL